MRILALDLGTKTGWAFFDGEKVTSGTWQLMTPKEVTAMRKAKLDRSRDPRTWRLRENIKKMLPADLIIFEDVQFSKTQLQAQMWGSLRGIVWLFQNGMEIQAVPVGTLKKFATGKGNAQKEDLKRALTGTIEAGILSKMDDNEVDAYWLLQMARVDHMNESS